MQHNGEFIYIKMDKLVGKSNAQVQQVIIKTIVDQAVKAELTQAQADLATMERLKLGAEADLKALKDKIAALSEVKAFTGSVTDQVNWVMTRSQHVFDGNFTITIREVTGYNPDLTPIFGRTLAHVSHNSSTLHAAMDADTLYAIQQLSRKLAADAYDRGYEDGYKDGYADGYRDGVRDAKAA